MQNARGQSRALEPSWSISQTGQQMILSFGNADEQQLHNCWSGNVLQPLLHSFSDSEMKISVRPEDVTASIPEALILNQCREAMPDTPS